MTREEKLEKLLRYIADLAGTDTAPAGMLAYIRELALLCPSDDYYLDAVVRDENDPTIPGADEVTA